MKKIILAATIVLTTGALTFIGKETTTKTVVSVKSAIHVDNNLLATAD